MSEFKVGDFVKLNLGATDYWASWYLKKEANSIFKIISYNNRKYRIEYIRKDGSREFSITRADGIKKCNVINLPDELFKM